MKNNRINVDVSGAGEIETLDIRRQGDVFIINIRGDQISIINQENESWNLVNGVADQQSVDNIGRAVKAHFKL
ncbi:hypothetical protein H8S90_20280 [Olivibacter sp. SDN3]|uniref:hypothetical protein n=1 Tax=Olivibacter sp. SDN3 TaxID=2764720 RepID=UPI0016519DCF|nr:hypothetical protein [Olivibacter sp. SDN3]QNL49063.1 hypothetical protein H8S90_20280 [Olivibacter sp. SDN3]